MQYDFSQLDRSHNSALLELAATRNTGSTRFTVSRGEDFFAASDELGPTKYFGLFRRDALIACAGVSRQKRFIDGVARDAFYLHDIRVHPTAAGGTAYYRLLANLVATYTASGEADWIFGTILDSNPSQRAMTRGDSMLPGGQLLGRTIHIGVPLFVRRERPRDVEVIGADEAWQIYRALAARRQFAPCDELIFTQRPGVYLAIRAGAHHTAVCKVVGQSNAREIVATEKTDVATRLVNCLCRARGVPTLPAEGQPLQLGYLAYCASVDAGARSIFLDFAAANFRRRFSYVFYGARESELNGRSGRFDLRLSSSTFGYGAVPSGLSLEFHELTLI